jgi:hypothetical protein
MDVKKMVSAAALLLVISALAANIQIPRAVERVWFDDSDNLWVRFGPEADAWDVGSLGFATSSGTYNFPCDYTLPPELPFEINLSQAIPGFTINRAEDFFIVDTDPYDDPLDETVSWGPQNDTSVNIHPLTAGQSVVQYSVGYQIYMGEWESMHVWAKDNGTAYVHPYCPATLCTLSVQVNDLNGQPASSVPIHLNYGTYPDTVWPDAHTNSNGWWQKQYFYAQPLRFGSLVRQHPARGIQIKTAAGKSRTSGPLRFARQMDGRQGNAQRGIHRLGFTGPCQRHLLHPSQRLQRPSGWRPYHHHKVR